MLVKSNGVSQLVSSSPHSVNLKLIVTSILTEHCTSILFALGTGTDSPISGNSNQPSQNAKKSNFDENKLVFYEPPQSEDFLALSQKISQNRLYFGIPNNCIFLKLGKSNGNPWQTQNIYAAWYHLDVTLKIAF